MPLTTKPVSTGENDCGLAGFLDRLFKNEVLTIGD